MFLSGQETYPAERTLLTTGVLDAVMTARFKKQKRLETPWLSKIAYQSPNSPGRRAIFGDGVPQLK